MAKPKRGWSESLAKLESFLQETIDHYGGIWITGRICCAGPQEEPDAYRAMDSRRERSGAAGAIGLQECIPTLRSEANSFPPASS